MTEPSKDKDSGRILFACGSTLSKNGTGSMIHRWTCELTELYGRHIDLMLSQEPDGTPDVEHLRELGCKVYALGGVAPHKAITTLRDIVKQTKPAIVHIHTHSSHIAFCWGLATRLAHTDALVVQHSHNAGLEQSEKYIQIINGMERQMVPWVSDAYLACSDKAAEFLFPKRVAAKAHIIANDAAVEGFRFNPARRDEVRRELGIDECLVFGHIGRFTYQKNQGAALRIFAAIREKNPNAHLVLVGTGPEPYLSEAEARIDEMGLRDFITRLDYSDDVAGLMQAFDVLLLPSRFEGNPVVVTEALAAGLPCLVSDTITRQCAPLGNVIFLPADDPSAWVDALADNTQFKDRETVSEEHQQLYSGANSSTATLNEFYDGLLEKGV